MGKPILCLDFDGVIHSYTSGWKGAHIIPDPPVEGAIDFIKVALEHFEVHVYSSRSHQLGGINAMQLWFQNHAGSEVQMALCFPEYKPSAMITIDDRALTFTGVWPDVKSLLTFKPWNKK
jgi:hypothetical protein